MAGDQIGNPKLVLTAESDKLSADLKAAQAKVGAAMDAAAKTQKKVQGQIQAQIDKINATKATASMQILAQAFDQVGGRAKLSDEQIKRLTADVERLAAAGAKVPKNLSALRAPTAGPSLGAAGTAALTSALPGPSGAIGAGLSALGPAGLVAAAGIGAVTVGFGLATKAASDFLERASTLNKLSATTGLGTEFLQRLDAASAQVGVSLDESAGAVFNLEKRIGAAVQGNKEAAQSFTDIGVSLASLKGKGPEEQFKIVATALSTIQDQSQFVAAGTDVMGKGFSSVAALIRSDFVGAMESASVVSDAQIRKAADIGDAFTRLGTASETLKLQLGAAFLGVASGGGDATAAIDTITKAIVGLSNIVKDETFQKGLKIALGVVTSGASDLLGGAVSALASRGAGQVDAGKAAAEQARKLATSKQEVLTLEAQAAAALREIKKQEAEDQKKVTAEAQKYAQELERIAEEERKGAVEANKRWSQEQDAIDKVNTAIKKHISDLQVGVFGTSGQAATDAAHEFDLLQTAIAGAGKTTSDMTVNELAAYEQQLMKIEIATRAWPEENEKVRKTLRGVQAQIDEFDSSDAFEQPREKTEKIKEETIEWSGILANVAHQLEAMGGAGGPLGKILGGVSGIGALFDKKGIFGKGLGAGFKDAQGGLGLGSVLKGASGLLGGVTAGIGIGKAILSGITGFLHRNDWKKAAGAAGKEFGDELGKQASKELSNAILKRSKDLHISLGAASLLHINDALKESGKSALDFADEMSHLMTGIADGSIPAKEGTEALGEAFGELQKQSEAGSFAATQAMGALAAQARATGVAVPEITEAINAGIEQATSGLDSLVKGIGVSTTKEAGDQALIFSSVFWAKVKTSGTIEAVKSMGGTFDALKKKMKDSGIDEAALASILGPLQAQFSLVGNEATKGALEGIGGLQQVLEGMTKAGFVDTASFSALQSQAVSAFGKLTAGGADTKAALQSVAPLLGQMQQQAQALGVSLDPATQALTDQAKAAGIAFPTEPLQQTNILLGAILKQMGGEMPAAIGQASTALGTLPGQAQAAGAGMAQGLVSATSGISGHMDGIVSQAGAALGTLPGHAEAAGAQMVTKIGDATIGASEKISTTLAAGFKVGSGAASDVLQGMQTVQAAAGVTSGLISGSLGAGLKDAASQAGGVGHALVAGFEQVNAATGTVLSGIETLGTAAVTASDKAKKGFVDGFDAAKGKFETLKASLKNLTASPLILQIQNTGIAGGNSLPQFAAGGLVNRPTFALVGESGPELIIPLKSIQPVKAGDGAKTFAPQFLLNVKVEVSGSADGQDIADQVAAQVEQEHARLNGSLRRQWERFVEEGA